MTNDNSAPDQQKAKIRPDDLMSELNLKKSTYYDDLKFLKLKAEKDEDGKAYLTNEQAEEIRALRSHVSKTGKREDFEYAPLAISSNNELATNPDNNDNQAEDIYVKAEEPTNNIDINNLMRAAAELKTRELATPDLIIRELANRMNEEDLPEDLKGKLNTAREVANPKWTPADIAGQLLNQHRQQKAQIQAQG